MFTANHIRSYVAILHEMASSSLPQQALGYFEQLRNTVQSLSILVIGETGSGKTSLVNNLLGEEIAKEEGASTSPITTFRGAVQGVSVTVYEVGGLSVEDEQHQRELQALILSGSLSFILYCFNMSETRMRQSLINTFKVFHSAGINWNKTVIALTFADSLPVPKTMRRDPNFNAKQHFTARVKEWKDQVIRVVNLEVGVPMETSRLITMLPTTGDPDELLPTGEEWCATLWSAMLDAPTQKEKQPSTSTNRRRTPPDSAYSSEEYGIPPVAQPHTRRPPLSGQQQLVSAKGVVTLCVVVVLIGASFAVGGVLGGVVAAAGVAVVGLVSKMKGVW